MNLAEAIERWKDNQAFLRKRHPEKADLIAVYDLCINDALACLKKVHPLFAEDELTGQPRGSIRR